MDNSANFSETLKIIKNTYQSVGKIQSLDITVYGPRVPDENPTEVRKVTTNGVHLKRASSNPKQGLWLADLASNATSTRSCIIEIGTCVGISGMFLLAGMARSGGGHLVTFEGSPELASIAKSNMEKITHSLPGVSFEIEVGPLDSTFYKKISSLNNPINLAFIDGNHREEPTLEYHNEIRKKMHKTGVIVHDDIAWGEGMARAWERITTLESQYRIDELKLGGRPSRGIIYFDQKSTGSINVLHIDGVFERIARVIKNKIS